LAIRASAKFPETLVQIAALVYTLAR
jgi:hypothetical protein